MTSVFQLYGRPLEDSAALPPLLITGSVPGFVPGAAYEGRLQIINAVGKCALEVVESSLPPGAYSFIDNFEEEIVLRWPAFTQPDEPTTDVPNGNFEGGDEGSWRFGAGWSLESGNAETGTYAGRFANHRGIASIESRRVPYNGETISASVRFQQGASSEGNLVGRIVLVWCDANGNMLPGGEGKSFSGGTLIRGAKNGEWKTSSVTASSPTAKTVAVGFSANRKRENHPARVDNFTWNHSYLVGVNSDLDFSVTFKVTDSANRVAYWTGILSEVSIYRTSLVYPVVIPPDSVFISPFFVSAETAVGLINYEVDPRDAFALEPIFVSAETQSIFIGYSVEVESVKLTPIFVSAATADIFVSQPQPVENIKLTPVFVTASTVQVLISQTQPVENIKLTPFFVEATLS